LGNKVYRLYKKTERERERERDEKTYVSSSQANERERDRYSTSLDRLCKRELKVTHR